MKPFWPSPSFHPRAILLWAGLTSAPPWIGWFLWVNFLCLIFFLVWWPAYKAKWEESNLQSAVCCPVCSLQWSCQPGGWIKEEEGEPFLYLVGERRPGLNPRSAEVLSGRVETRVVRIFQTVCGWGKWGREVTLIQDLVSPFADFPLMSNPLLFGLHSHCFMETTPVYLPTLHAIFTNSFFFLHLSGIFSIWDHAFLEAFLILTLTFHSPECFLPLWATFHFSLAVFPACLFACLLVWFLRLDIYVAQGSLEILGSRDLPLSTSWVARTMGQHHGT